MFLLLKILLVLLVLFHFSPLNLLSPCAWELRVPISIQAIQDSSLFHRFNETEWFRWTQGPMFILWISIELPMSNHIYTNKKITRNMMKKPTTAKQFENCQKEKEKLFQQKRETFCRIPTDRRIWVRVCVCVYSICVNCKYVYWLWILKILCVRNTKLFNHAVVRFFQRNKENKR